MSSDDDNKKIATITHSASGSSCRIHSTGATVISFRTTTTGDDGGSREHLFVSKDAVMNGSKAIRGGIPICFPVFGPPKVPGSTMPQHGYARVNDWKLVQTYDETESAGATYTLDLADAVAGRGENNPWSVDRAKLDGTECLLQYDVRLEAKQLTTTLLVNNTGESSFDFQALLHNYFAVDDHAATDGSKTFVHGLGGYAITDKVSGDSGHIQSYDDNVVIDGETDRIYIHPDDHPVVHADICVGSPEWKIRLEAAGQVDDNVAPVSCVVWNPHREKAAAMSDFGTEQHVDMICVEPGLIGHQALLPPGKQARLTQSIIV